MKLGNLAPAMIFALVLGACGPASDHPEQAPGTRLLAVGGTSVALNYQDAVQQLYISYFGRPADSGGLANFSAALANLHAPAEIQGLDAAYSTSPALKALVDSFQISAESLALYGNSGTTAFVSSIYQNVLGRTPTLGDAGVAFWAGAIDSGHLSRGKAALSIMAGALANTSPQGKLDAATVNNKVNVAKSFTTLTATAYAGGYVGDAAAAQARALLSSVTATTNLTSFQTSAANLAYALQQAAPLPLTGLVSNGSPVSGATVCPYAITSTGARGAAIGECAKTGADGKFALSFNRAANGASALYEATGGTYRNPHGGENLALPVPLHSALGSVYANNSLAITTLTDIAYATFLRSGAAVTVDLLRGYNTRTASAFGLKDIQYTYPIDMLDGAKPVSDIETQKYALALGTVSAYQDLLDPGTSLKTALQSIAACLQAPQVSNCGTGATGVGTRLASAMANFKAVHAGYADIVLPVAKIGPPPVPVGFNAGAFPRLTVTSCSTPIDYIGGPCSEQDKAYRILVQCNRSSGSAAVDAYFLRAYSLQLDLDQCLADNSSGDYRVLYAGAVFNDKRSLAEYQAAVSGSSVCPVGYTKTVVANFCSRNGTGGLCSPGDCPPVAGSPTPPSTATGGASAAAACASAPYLNGSGDPQSDSFYKLAQFDACLHRTTGASTYDAEGRNACALGDAIPRASGSNFRSQYCPFPY